LWTKVKAAPQLAHVPSTVVPTGIRPAGYFRRNRAIRQAPLHVCGRGPLRFGVKTPPQRAQTLVEGR
jgi:hypothetical protein